MDLRLERQPSSDHSTLGALYLGDLRLCYTLEDVVRDGPKLAHETAIPFGRYRVTLYQSPRFNRRVPLLHDVPDFTQVEIHGGNTDADTSGCILVGAMRGVSSIHQAEPALHGLVSRMAIAIAGGEDVWLSIVPEPPRTLNA